MIETVSNFTSLYLQDTITLNLIKEYYQFKNNKNIAIGVRYEGVSKTATL